MSRKRKQPATFHALDAAGRRWTIRVGPLGVEAVNHEAEVLPSGFRAGQQRYAISWRDLLPADGSE